MKKTLYSLIIVTMFVCVSQAKAVLIFEDTFNTENGGVGVFNYTDFANWTVSNGTVDLIGNGFFDFFPSHGLYIDLDGSTWDAGIMTQDPFVFEPGAYVLSFDLAGNQRNSGLEFVNVALEIAGFSETFSLRRNEAFRTFSYAFNLNNTVIGSIVFNPIGGDNYGMLLDNASLDYSPTSVPGPASMALMGIGALGMLGLRRKKQQLV